MENGWIKIHRKITEWEWYSENNTKLFFFHLLLTCNYKATKWRGIDLEPGETIQCLKTLSRESNLSIQNTRTAIANMLSTGELTQRQHDKNRIIKLKNYSKYQVANTEVTRNQHGSNTKVTLDKEVKKDKKEKKRESTKKVAFAPPTIQEIKDYAIEKGYNVDAEHIWNYYGSADWHDAKGNKIKNWKQKLIGVWFKEENKAHKKPKTNNYNKIEIA